MSLAAPVEQVAARSGVGIRLFSVLCAAFALFHIYTAATGSFDPMIQRGIFIGTGLLLGLWQESQRPAVGRPLRVLLLALGLIGLYAGIHAALNHARFMDVMNDMEPRDFLVAGAMLVVVLVATQRLLGWALPVMTTLGVLYYALGQNVISGLWQPPRASMDTIVSTLYASTSGVFGFMADIGTSVIAIYVIYGALLMATGAGEVFVQVASRIAGRGHGGPAKIAVITSALFGTVSGSAVANVMAVGTLTIPTMRRAGYPKALAAGVEASASAGGQIMPPIMGAGAFLMSELLNIPYIDVAKAAVLPAILYFMVIFVSVDLYARRENLGNAPDTGNTRIDPEKGVPLALSVIALVTMLALDYTPTLAAVIGGAVLLLVAFTYRIASAALRNGAAAVRARVVEFIHVLGKGLVDGGKGLIMISILLACAGILAAILSASGLGSKVSSELIALAGNQLLFALVLSAVLCILLGMDVPTTASYILTASVAAPLLTRLGLPPLTAHMFIFYFAILSAITPPVCASVYAAAAIAGERFWTVARYALLMAGAVYVIPFMMVYRPGLLLQSDVPHIAYDVMMTAIAIFAMCGASIGYLAGRVPWPLRIALFVSSILFFIPGYVFDAAGMVALVAVIVAQRVRLRRGPAAEGIAQP